MNKLLEKYLLRSIVRAPEGDKGNGDGDANGGGNNGAAGDGGAGDGGGGGSGGAGDLGDGKPSALKNPKGLLGTRKAKEDGDGDGDGGDNGANGGDKPGADGRPAHIPEKFWDAEKKTVKSDDLAKAYGSLETKLGELKRSKGLGADVPEKPEEYFGDEGLKLEGADRFGDMVPADDPGLRAFGKVCHKYGIGKEAAFGIAKEMFKEMNEHAPAPVDLEAEREALGDNADELIDGTFLWLERLERDKKLGESDIEIAIDLATTADGVRFLNKFRGMSGEMPIPVGMPAGHKGMSGEEWHAEMRKAVQAKDYKRQAELEKIGETINGTEAAAGTPYQGIPLQRDIDRTARK